MEREEAIKILQGAIKKPNTKDGYLGQAINMAIKALEQEPCEDAISRKDLKNWIKRLRTQLEPKNYQTLREYHIADNMLLNLYQLSDSLPSVTPTQKWIPISERLPEEFESVLVCYKSQGGMAQCVAERLVNMDGSSRWSGMYGQEPIAWMPLPEPYKAEKESEE